ncbi:hypothetical protein K438DRAFT_1842678 [Mycena galopus ATCC 62051]|nr:hypothetical protein K438DRAFT_1842678 [Mycena galopus ATCC 62051]
MLLLISVLCLCMRVILGTGTRAGVARTFGSLEMNLRLRRRLRIVSRSFLPSWRHFWRQLIPRLHEEMSPRQLIHRLYISGAQMTCRFPARTPLR